MSIGLLPAAAVGVLVVAASALSTSVRLVDGNTLIAKALEFLGIPVTPILADAAGAGQFEPGGLLVCGEEAPITGSPELAAAIEAGTVVLSLTGGIAGDFSWLPPGYELEQGSYSVILDPVRDTEHAIFTSPNRLQADCLGRVNPTAQISVVNIADMNSADTTGIACHSPGERWRVLAEASTQHWGWPNRPPTPFAVLLEASLGTGGLILAQTASIQRKWVETEGLAERSIAGKLIQNLVEYGRRWACETAGESFTPSPYRFPPIAPAPEGWMPVALPRFTDSGPYMDYSVGVEAPAGTHGFVREQDGELVCEDGEVLRLWSNEVFSFQLFSIHDHGKLAACADRIASLGANCVRIYPVGHSMSVEDFEAIHRRYEINDYEFDPKRLDALDFFYARARDRGLYFFITIECGLYCNKYFDPEAEAAVWRMQRKFLEHVNPYTGLRYLDDPALAVIEIANETSFSRWDVFRAMPAEQWERAHGLLKSQWNAWLRERYESLDGLRTAWTDAHGACALQAGQDPWQDDVELDLQHYNRCCWKTWDRVYDDPETSPAIYNDVSCFFSQLMRDYFERTQRALEGLGVKCVISHQEGHPNDPSLRNNRMTFSGGYRGGATLDRTFDCGSMMRSANMPLRYMSLVPNLHNSASGVYEFNDGWPNPYRADSAFLAAAYCGLQGFDLLSLHVIMVETFLFGCLPTQFRGWYLLPDPVKAFAFTLAGLMFRRGDVAEAPTVVDVFLSPTDQHYVHRNERRNYAYRYFSNMVRVNSVQGDDGGYRGDAEVVINTGWSADADFRDARRAIVIGDNPACDLHNNELEVERPARLLYPDLEFVKGGMQLQLGFSQIGWDDQVLDDCPLQVAVRLESLPAGAIPIGVNEDEGVCLGFINDRHMIVLDAPRLEEELPESDILYRLYIDALHHWGLFPHNHEMADQGLMVSHDGTIRRDYRHGVMIIDTERSQGLVGGIQGLPQEERSFAFGDCSMNCRTDLTTLFLTSFDGRPIAGSQRLLLTALGRVENTGQIIEERHDAEPPRESVLWNDVMLNLTNRPYRLVDEGEAPIVVEPVTATVILDLDASEMIVTTLDPETGQHRDRVGVERVEDGRFLLQIGPEYQTCLYQIDVAHT